MAPQNSFKGILLTSYPLVDLWFFSYKRDINFVHVIFLSTDTLYFVQLEPVICCLNMSSSHYKGFPVTGKESTCQCRRCQRHGFDSWIRNIPWHRIWQPTPVYLPGKSLGQRSLVGCSPWGSEESDTTEWPHFHFSLSCIGEGNGNPLQYSCL